MTNQILPFATGVGANVVDYATWSAETTRQSGFQSGIAPSDLFNTTWRQSSFVASMIGEFIADALATDVLDDGNISTLESQFIAALQATVGSVPDSSLWHWGRDSGTLNALSVTVTPIVSGLVDGLVVLTLPAFTSNSQNPTLTLPGQSAKIIVKSNGADLDVGEINANTLQAYMYDSILDKYRIIGSVNIPQVSILHRGNDVGSANSMSVSSVTPAIVSVVDGMVFLIRKSTFVNTAALALTIQGTAGGVVWPDNTAFTGGEWKASSIGMVMYDGTLGKYILLGPVSPFSFVVPGSPIPLLAPRTYYVSNSGSDSNDGLTVGTAFATIQKAIDTTNKYNLNGYDVTINVASGTYARFATKFVNGSGKISIIGNEFTPSNVLINSAAGAAILCTHDGYEFKGIKVTAPVNGVGSDTGIGLRVTHSRTFVNNIEFGTCIFAHCHVEAGGLLSFEGGAVIISGSSGYHIGATGSATITLKAWLTITTPQYFSNAFVVSDSVSLVRYPYNSITGTATGYKFSIALNGIIDTQGSGINYFPGNLAGIIASGGQYV